VVIKCLKGLGDAVYTFPIVSHFCKKTDVKVITPYPIIFDSLHVDTTTDYSEAFDMHPRYTANRNTTNWQYVDMLNSVNLPMLPFDLIWGLGFTDEFKSKFLSDIMIEITVHRKKICVIKEPCAAHMHKKRNDFSMAPRRAVMQDWIKANQQYCFVSVGHNELFKSRLSGIDFDLTDNTTVQDLISLCSIADIISTQVGHLVPIAQGLSKNIKVFYPEKITDGRMKHISPNKIERV